MSYEEYDSQKEFDRLRALPLEERSRPLQDLIDRMEEELEEKSPGPPA